MTTNTERLGRNARRTDRLKVKIEMLPTLKRNLPLTEPMSEEQILKMDEPPKPLDVSDALAIGLCHINQNKYL